MNILDKIVINGDVATISNDEGFLFCKVRGCEVFESSRGWTYDYIPPCVPFTVGTHSYNFNYGIYKVGTIHWHQSWMFAFHSGGIQEIDEIEFSETVQNRMIEKVKNCVEYLGIKVPFVLFKDGCKIYTKQEIGKIIEFVYDFGFLKCYVRKDCPMEVRLKDN